MSGAFHHWACSKEAYLDSLNLQPARKLHQQTGNWTATWLFGRLLGPSSELTSSSNYCWGKNIEWFSIHLSSKLTVSIQTLLLLILERPLHRKGLSMHRVLMQFVYTLDTRAIQSMTDTMIQNCTYVLQYTKHNINIHLLSKISKISQEQTNTHSFIKTISLVPTYYQLNRVKKNSFDYHMWEVF